MNKILITGGSGMVGSAMKELIPGAKFPTRRELDLLNKNSSFEYLSDFQSNIPKFDIVYHLAAIVGGVKTNMEQPVNFLINNLEMNSNLLQSAYYNKIPKLVSVLSTCIYPKEEYVTYPLTEDQLYVGPPHESNYGYGYAKRMLAIMSQAYKEQYGCNFVCVIPNNIAGPHDNFDLNSSHVIPAIIRKIYEAKINNQEFVEIWGNGLATRQFTYSKDIAKILLLIGKYYNSSEPINIGSNEEISIRELAEKIKLFLDYNGSIKWDLTKPNGMNRKPSSNKKFLSFGFWKQEDYTPIEVWLKETCEWFVSNYPKVRGINK